MQATARLGPINSLRLTSTGHPSKNSESPLTYQLVVNEERQPCHAFWTHTSLENGLLADQVAPLRTLKKR